MALPLAGLAALAGLAVWRTRPSIVIVTAHYKEDLRWLRDSPYPVVVCDKPGADPMPFPADPKCSLSVNRGREASSFLTWIIENYDALPPHVAFIHGHQHAWHQNVPLLEAIDRARVEAYDYINLNVKLQSKVLDKDALARHPSRARDSQVGHEGHEQLKRHWDRVFAPIIKKPFPEHLRFMCCAQFVVSARAIRRHPKAVYQRLLDLVMDESAGTDFQVGVMLEFVWHMLFEDVGGDMCAGIPDCSEAHYRRTRFR